MILSAATQAGAVVVAEEHQVAGGLGGAVAELLAREAPSPMEFIGVHDEFGQSGEPVELLKHYGLDAVHIKRAVERVLKRV